MKVKITYVDMYGFLGRENHPEKEMIGQVARVYNSYCGSYLGSSPIEVKEIETTPELINHPDLVTVVFYDCFLADGSKVTLANFEVEVVTSFQGGLR